MPIGVTRVLKVQAPLVIHPSDADGLDATCPLRRGKQAHNRAGFDSHRASAGASTVD